MVPSWWRPEPHQSQRRQVTRERFPPFLGAIHLVVQLRGGFPHRWSSSVPLESCRYGYMDRRSFLARSAALGALALGDTLLPRALALAGAVPSSQPYGPLGNPDSNGLMLPHGFRSRVVGHTGQRVPGTDYVWHQWPDGGACFAAPGGGWVYVSNSEIDPGGGVSAIRFGAKGEIEEAYRVLAGTRRNCAGGATPWGTWLSCEEVLDGHVWECDPLRSSQGLLRPSMGTFMHEAAAVDPRTGHVYLTEDDPNGRLYRFAPHRLGQLGGGTLHAARLDERGQVSWVRTSSTAPDRESSTTAFNGGEGLWIDGDAMYMTTKYDVRVWRLNLRTQQMGVIYQPASLPAAKSTAGSAASTCALNAVDNVTVHRPSGDVFVAEDGGNMELCIFTRVRGTVSNAPFLRIVGHDLSEVTGPAFSPDGTRLYVSSQRGSDNVNGQTYEISGPFRLLPRAKRQHA